MIINNYRHSIKSIFRPLYHSYEIFLYKFLHNSSYLTNYKNIHRNESCLIVGNGPSLDIKDLERIKDAHFLPSIKFIYYKIKAHGALTFICAKTC